MVVCVTSLSLIKIALLLCCIVIAPGLWNTAFQMQNVWDIESGSDQLQGMDKIMETLNNIGIKLFVWLHWKNISCEYLLFFCLFKLFSASVNALWTVSLVMGLQKYCKMGDLSDFQRANCWCVFSWSICNQNRHFIRCIQSSSFQGYDGVHKLWEDVNSYEE